MKKVTFSGRSGFHAEVQNGVNHYFESNNISKHANWRMVLKTVVILTGCVVSYTSLILSAGSPLLTVVSAIALAQAIVLVGFNIMHDGNHGSYSRHRRWNQILGFTLDLVGGSSLFWQSKHNILHHTYTNIHEVDDDLDVPGILRFSPDQQWRPWHRYQHWYAFPAYCLMTLLWSLKSDFDKFFSGKIGEYDLPRPSVGQVIVFFGARLTYFGYMLVVPMLFHPVLHVLGIFLLIHAVVGLTLAIVFQLAHVVEDCDFIRADEDSREIENEWAIHQVETTANFSPKSKFASWYCGGLNFQIEHHLFPRVCHIHYPAISKIVEEACRKFDIEYVSYPTFKEAVSAHRHFLRTLGAPAPEQTAVG
jgi:linoleoyl-CoA desaturase